MGGRHPFLVPSERIFNILEVIWFQQIVDAVVVKGLQGILVIGGREHDHRVGLNLVEHIETVSVAEADIYEELNVPAEERSIPLTPLMRNEALESFRRVRVKRKSKNITATFFIMKKLR